MVLWCVGCVVVCLFVCLSVSVCVCVVCVRFVRCVRVVCALCARCVVWCGVEWGVVCCVWCVCGVWLVALTCGVWVDRLWFAFRDPVTVNQPDMTVVFVV